MMSENNSWTEKWLNVLFILMMLSLIVNAVTAVPVGPNITFSSTTNGSPTPAAQITTYGGSFTTLTLNVTGETYRWKAYIGNVSGKLALDDANGRSIFDWSVSSVTGEVYTSRYSNVDWSTVACANTTTINSEDVALNMSVNNNPDTINKTFTSTVHRSFYVGTQLIVNSTCRSIATYVNGSAQAQSENASFQEILLQDSTSKMVYSTLVNLNTTGYNNEKYDFQMIVAENEYQITPTTYYLFVELV